MSRILILAVVAVLLFGGVLVADQALQNPDLTPDDADDEADQQSFVEAAAPMLEAGIPVALFGLVIGTILAAVRVVG